MNMGNVINTGNTINPNDISNSINPINTDNKDNKDVKDDKVLLLIDLQTEFYATRKLSVVKIVNIEIKKAKKKNIPIICLTYSGYGQVIDSIKCNLDGYHKLHNVVKYDCCGGDEVNEQFQKIGFTGGDIFVCGVNTNECVKETVESLRELNSNYIINIIANGCNTYCDKLHRYYMNFFAFRKRIKVRHTITKKPYRCIVTNGIRKTKKKTML